MAPEDVIPGRVDILGVPVAVTDQERAVATIGQWIAERRSGAGRAPAHYVCACDVHSVMRAQSDPVHMRSLRSADMVLADGMPLAWVGRLRGERGMGRVCGPDLLSAICERSVAAGWNHYFYGGAPGVAGKLAERLAERYEGLNVAGTDCPPFRERSAAEVSRDLDRMNAADPDIIWVGLGCPKQEIWMLEHHARLQGRVVIGVGAAFDFHSGRIERAPVWMRDHGLEWLHRFYSEPQRLWRRYLVLAPKFVALTLAQSAGLLARRTAPDLTAQR